MKGPEIRARLGLKRSQRLAGLGAAALAWRAGTAPRVVRVTTVNPITVLVDVAAALLAGECYTVTLCCKRLGMSQPAAS
jgi:hypothetical protein